MKRIELKEVKNLNKEMFGILTIHNKAILEAIGKVKKVIGLDFHINPLPVFEIIRKEKGNYLNNGNTPTEGYEWIAYWAFPINHQPINEFNYNSVLKGYCTESIIFTLDNYNERCLDGRISGCKFFSLHFNFGKFKEIVDVTDCSHKNQIRLDYQNDNYTELSIINAINLSKIITCVRKLKEAVETMKEVDNAH